MGEGIISARKNLVKGIVNTKIDALVNHRNSAGAFDKRDELLKALNNWTEDFLEILKRHAGVTAKEADYLHEYWFDPNWADPNSECWWREKQPIEPIIRQGLITAIDVATQDPDTGAKRAQALPIDSYWIYSGYNQFEVIVTWTDHQVTRMILTPPPPEDAPVDRRPKNSKARIQVIRREVAKGDRPAVQPEPETEEDIVQDVKSIDVKFAGGVKPRSQVRIVTRRLKAFLETPGYQATGG
jgi:hypothetical protein